MFRWLVGGSLCALSFALILASLLNEYMYGWDWRVSAVIIGSCVVLVASSGLLVRREWARRVLMGIAIIAALVSLGSVVLEALKGRAPASGGSLAAVALCLLCVGGLALPSVRSAMVRSR
jgi:hypothetical protein